MQLQGPAASAGGGGQLCVTTMIPSPELPSGMRCLGSEWA